MSLLLSWLILSVAVWLTAMILPGFRVRDFGSAILVSALFGVLNFLLGWLLFTFFTVITLGVAWLLAFITRWVIDAILLMLTSKMTRRLTIDGCGTALLAALLMSLLGTAGQWLLTSPAA